MKKALLATVAALFILSATPALAAYDNYWPQTYRTPVTTYKSDGIFSDPLIIGLIAAAIIATIIIEVASKSSGSAGSLPKELQPKHSAEHYDQEAARVRAFARQLQAEAELAETKLRASRLGKPPSDPKPRGRK